MSKKRLLCFLFLIPVFNNASYSQRLLTLEECRNLAIANNKSLKMATEEVRVAYYQKKEAFTKYFPELSFQGAYFRNEKNLNLLPSSITVPNLPSLPGVILPIPPGTEIPLPDNIRKLGELDIKNVWVGGFSLVQPLFMGGKIIAYNDIQKYAEELAQSKKDTKLKEIILELDNTYWQVVSLANKKNLTDSYTELLRKMESDVSIMQQEGVATKADRLTVSVKLNEAEVAQTKVENGLSLCKMLLCQLCGLDINENIKLKDETLTDLGVSEQELVMPNISEVLSNRSEIKSLELATKIYKKKEKVMLSEFLPSVAFMANYLWTNPSGFNGFENKLAGMWNVGLLVKVPFNISSNSYKLNASKAQTRIMQYELDDVKDKIQLQVNQSVYKVNEANKKLAMTSKNIDKANENLRYANAGFDEGVISASDVLAAHTAWISAHSEYLDAQIDLKLCKIYLDKALGRKF